MSRQTILIQMMRMMFNRRHQVDLFRRISYHQQLLLLILNRMPAQDSLTVFWAVFLTMTIAQVTQGIPGEFHLLHQCPQLMLPNLSRMFVTMTTAPGIHHNHHLRFILAHNICHPNLLLRPNQHPKEASLGVTFAPSKLTVRNV